MGDEKRGRGRPRREGADEEILAVALQMLRESGHRALTVDAVAERAGVAKTTVYRRWPTKSALIAAAIAPLIASRRDEIDAVLREIAELRSKLVEITGDAVIADALIE
ncbi:MAG TPA: helix-turn-helix domain-containing protein [Thermoanaerobaculia bacterium]|nr:helix-turn-helix domain-containing protein [Thermoanaerobaculia bacterium]